MAAQDRDITWRENPDDIIVLVNRSKQNYILEMPSGRYRLDVGTRMRTLRSILKIKQVNDLVDQGLITVEH